MFKFELIAERSLWLVAALVCCFMASGAAQASDDHDDEGARTRTVKCDASESSVQSVIDKVKAGRDTTIFILGFCDESVSIVKDGITLSRNRDGYGTAGGTLREVKVTGAQRVVIEYLELTGDGYGVLAQEGAAVTIRHNNIHENMASGVGAFHEVFARVESNTIERNGLRDEEESGIDASGGVTVRSAGNFIADNNYAAIATGNMSFFRSQAAGTSATRDTFLQKGCTLGQDAGTCGADGTLAIDCYKSVLCDIRGTNVTGGIEISSMSNLEARGSTIDGNVEADSQSHLALRDTVHTGSVIVW